MISQVWLKFEQLCLTRSSDKLLSSAISDLQLSTQNTYQDRETILNYSLPELKQILGDNFLDCSLVLDMNDEEARTRKQRYYQTILEIYVKDPSKVVSCVRSIKKRFTL